MLGSCNPGDCLHQVQISYRNDTSQGIFTPCDVIVGGEDVSKHKHDPECLLMVLDKLGAAPGNTIYLSDSLVDSKTAERGVTPFFAVLSGITPRNAFNGYKVVNTLKNISELPV